MMIDLSNLTPTSDVTVWVTRGKRECNWVYFRFATKASQEIVDSLKPLEEIGRLYDSEFEHVDFHFVPRQHDKVAIAERIASHFESAGLKVTRSVSYLSDEMDGTVRKESVQSFVLI